MIRVLGSHVVIDIRGTGSKKVYQNDSLGKFVTIIEKIREIRSY